MLKQCVFAVLAVVAMMHVALAAVDVNKADQAALDGIRGIGPTMSKAIVDERKKGGNFKDWNDLQARVKGIGDKSSEKFSKAGLTVNGAPKPAAKSALHKKATETAAHTGNVPVKK